MELVSIVLPAGQAGERFEQATHEFAAVLASTPHEFVLVPSAATRPLCDRLAKEVSNARVCPREEERWGGAVRAGLADARGDLLVFANAGRTSAEALRHVLDLALAHPGVVLRANRRGRETMLKRIGSLLFNLECRGVLGVISWDVNGTPKAFPRQFDALLTLTRDDELLDVEFTVTCERLGYPTLEVPVREPEKTSGAVGLGTALQMYLRVPQLRTGR